MRSVTEKCIKILNEAVAKYEQKKPYVAWFSGMRFSLFFKCAGMKRKPQHNK